jgi:hypothetical protein
MPSGPWAVTPIFDEVFTVMPLASAPGLGREARAALDGWNAQPSHLAKDSGRSRFYDAAWKDSAYAFSVWRDRQRPGSYWSRYGPGERERFREAFFATFEEVFASIDLRRVYAGYRVGFADGWRYGVAVNAEWAYRQGYAAGFDEGVRAGAALSFPFLFDQAYASAYEREFQTWSHNPMPSLDDLFVADAGDDGVIEPGERILIAGDIVNYGGAPGTMEVHVTGAVLDGSNVTTVRLPARGRARMPQLGLRVADHVSVRTRSEVEVEIGADRRSVPIYVSRPLEIEEPLVESDPLHGRARVIVTVANRSRRPLRADTVISGASARDDRRDRLDIPAGGAARMEEVYEGFRPLDLIAGTPRWSASVSLAGVEHDARTIDVAPASTDLSSPDLVIYMVDMARSRQASHREVAHARSLLLDRMRADWDRAVAMDGNPYKSDFEEGSASTALGELVRVLHAERHAFASRSVFAGAGADIAALADDLPGTHPLLRKWMKRLAKRVG